MSGSDRTDGATDFPDDAAVLVAHGQWAVGPLQSAIRPEVRPADAGRRDANHCVGGLDDSRRFAAFQADVACPVKDGGKHGRSPSAMFGSSYR